MSSISPISLGHCTILLEECQEVVQKVSWVKVFVTTFMSGHFMFQIKLVNIMLFLIWLDSQVGVLRIWNVSRTTPIDNFKLKKTGFHCLHVLNSPPRKKCK